LKNGSAPPAGTPCGFGWSIPQSLKGQRLPNAPKNKIAINVQYDWRIPGFGTLTPSVTWRWVDKQYGSIFTRFYNLAPSWDQWDARIGWTSEDSNWTLYIYGKNLANKIGYAQGGGGGRYAGTINTGGANGPLSADGSGGTAPNSGYCNGATGALGDYGGFNQCNFVQGATLGAATPVPPGYGRVRGESAYGTVTGYDYNPPLTYGIQLQFKFF
jgi:hypothetical protein